MQRLPGLNRSQLSLTAQKGIQSLDATTQFASENASPFTFSWYVSA